MDAEFLSVISVAGRLLLYSSVCTIMWAYMTAELLHKKRKLTVLITWMLFRHVLITSFANIVLRYYFQDRLWWDFFFFLLMFLIIIGNCVTEYYTFEGTLSKVLAGSFLAEIVLIPSCYFSLGIVNMLEGQEFGVLEVELQAIDILLPILVIVFYLLTRYFFKNILHRFRDYNLHFSNLVWILVMMNLVSYFPKYAEESGFIMICLGNGLIIGMLIMFVLLKHALSLKHETEFLIEQQRMMEYHYLALQGQMTQMQEYQKMVDEQMVAVENRTVTRKNLSEYIDNLKQEYHQIWAGIYCNDRMIDAVLYSQTESLKKQGIDLKCNLAGYDRGTIEEKDLAQILMKMLA